MFSWESGQWDGQCLVTSQSDRTGNGTGDVRWGVRTVEQAVFSGESVEQAVFNGE